MDKSAKSITGGEYPGHCPITFNFNSTVRLHLWNLAGIQLLLTQLDLVIQKVLILIVSIFL